MIEEKIKKVEFLNVNDKENRKVVVTPTDDIAHFEDWEA